MALTKRLRYEILRRDNHTCRYCGGVAPDVKLTVDHVLPVALGGSDDAGNLVAACKDCNAGKSASNPDAPLVAQVADDAIRWAAAVAKATEMHRATRDEVRAYVGAVDHDWLLHDFGFRQKYTHDRPSDWADSVERLQARELPLDLALECIEAAMRARNVDYDHMWRYYMGICWRRLADIQADAKQIYDGGAVNDAP